MAELTPSTREAARRLGVSDTTMHKAERTGRIAREPDGQWNIAKTRARLLDTADPQRSPISGSPATEGTPFARLKVAQLAHGLMWKARSRPDSLIPVNGQRPCQ
jgi:DNA-binding XRE family transcriptional regulator